jgi:hypothetical protein
LSNSLRDIQTKMGGIPEEEKVDGTIIHTSSAALLEY